MKTIQLLFFLLVGLLLAGCSSRGVKRHSATKTAPLHEFALPVLPVAMGEEQQLDYLREHYWDRFRFADTLALREADTLQLLRRFGYYIALFADAPTHRAPIEELMRRASSSRPMLDLFSYLAEEVLHNPNSPLRNDELYIPVLEAQLAAPYYDEYERIIPEHDLRLARQNRLGEPANDFAYTLSDGRKGRLYGIEADYVLIFFNNPDCAMCKEIREAISASPLIMRKIADGSLKILALYPDEDLTAWHAYRNQIPARWINAYDAGCVLRETEAYALNAIPSLYLLDRQKRVLLKDGTEVAAVERELMR